MKIISLNAWRGEMEKELEKYIRQHESSTDIFCFQEAQLNCELVRNKVLNRWLSLTARYYYEGPDEEFARTTCFKNQYTLMGSGTLFGQDQKKLIALWVHLKTEEQEYWIVNVHGTSTPVEKNDSPERIAQSQKIIDFLSDKKGQRVVMGDFNLNPDTESVKLFERVGYRNLIREFNIDTTRNEIAWAKYPDNKHLFADYTFVSPEVTVLDFQVPKNEVSDHLPMELEIA